MCISLKPGSERVHRDESLTFQSESESEMRFRTVVLENGGGRCFSQLHIHKLYVRV